MVAQFIIKRAQEVATEAHKSQRLMGKDKLPFITHPRAVATWVKAAGGNPRQVAAAWMHDVPEDTDVTLEKILRMFDQEVHDLVDGLTDDPSMRDMPLAARKKLQAERVRNKCKGVKLVKLADQLVNLITVSEDPPTKWSRAKCLEYVEGARLVADACADASPALYQIFLKIYQVAKLQYS